VNHPRRMHRGMILARQAAFRGMGKTS